MKPSSRSGDRIPQAELSRLAQLFQAGRLADMEGAALKAAATWPKDGIAWKALGTVQLALGKDALSQLERARKLLPDDVEVLGNLGVMLGRRNRWAEAVECHRHALSIRPDLADAHCNLADALAALGQWDAAAASCRDALRLRPNFGAAFVNLGRAQAASGRSDDAATSYRRAIALQPASAQAHHGLALALRALAQPEAAAAALREALRLQPDHADRWFQLATLVVMSGRAVEAEAAYRRVLDLEPGHVEAYAALGDLAMGQGRPEEAVDAFTRALQLDPGAPALLGNLGNALLATNRVDAALRAHRAAVEAAPDDAVVHGNIAHAYVVAGQPEAAMPHLDRATALQPDHLAWRTEALFTRRYLDKSADDLHLSLEAARRYGELASARARPFDAWPSLGDPEKRLRIGFVSGDLRAHPVAWFLQSTLEALSQRGTLELWAYSTNARSDDVTHALRGLFSQWRHVEGDGDAALAERIRGDGIDVLIDLAGHTRHNRLPVFAWRPAPLQLSWLGSCATTGMTEIDAVVVDHWLAPSGTEVDFVEPLLRLPVPFLCFSPPLQGPAVDAHGAVGSGHDAPIRLACFNRLAKIGDAVIATWSRVLKTLPASTLALQDRALQDAFVRERMLHRFADHGIDANRLVLRASQSRETYLAAYREVDIALDPFPYPGGTTTCEALWMGVPVLTLAGDSALARQGVSLLRALDLQAWIASDMDDYVEKAVRHARSRAELAELKVGLRERLMASPLCDAAGFASALERALRDRWQARCRIG